MDVIAIQSAVILGVTGFVAKFISDPEERDVVLPITACLVGVVVGCYYGSWDVAHAIQGAILGGSVTGLYAVATGDGRKKSEQEIPVRSAN